MAKHIVIYTFAAVLLLSSRGVAQLTVQQPVVQSIGGNFAVSVPDRGGIHLGSISRAGSSRSSYGFPFTRGSSVGRFAEHTSMSAHVWIHDLREMDRMILDMADSASRSGQGVGSAAPGRSGLAWSEFNPQRGVVVADGLSSRRPTSLSVRRQSYGASSISGRSRYTYSGRDPSATVSPLQNSRRSKALDPLHAYRLGVEAEESGKLRLAKLHYEVAAQYGSDLARQKLAQITAQPVASK